MPGTFNGIRLRRITSLAMTSTNTANVTAFRVLEGPRHDLEAELRVGAPALLILSNQEVEGTIASFQSELQPIRE